MAINVWGKSENIFFTKIDQELTINNEKHPINDLYMSESEGKSNFYDYEAKEIGVIGNQFFLNKTILIDYTHKTLMIK
jgi:hypothetical protein